MAGRSLGKAGDDVVRAMRQIQRNLDGDQRRTIEKASRRAKLVHEGSIAAVVGSDMKLSGVNQRKGRPGGVRVGVRYSVKVSANRKVTSLMRATGPLQLVERDTDPRVIQSAYATAPRGSKKSLRSLQATLNSLARAGGSQPLFAPNRLTTSDPRQVLNIPGIGYRRSARHPGTSGQEPWAKGSRRARQPIRRVMRTETFRNVKRGAKP